MRPLWGGFELTQVQLALHQLKLREAQRLLRQELLKDRLRIRKANG